MEFVLSFEGDVELVKLSRIASRIDSEVIPRGMRKASLFLESYIKKQKLSGQVLKVRSNRLRESIASRVFKSGGNWIGEVGTNVSYAKIHETGKTITPKRAKSLTIPLSAAQTRAGVTRFSARQVIGSPSTYGYMDTFSKEGILFGKKVKKIVPLFVLAKEVKIPARPYMKPSLEESKSNIREIFIQEFKKVIESV